jgi:uncharacterized protein
MNSNARAALDRKGILAFLAITFAITYGVEGLLILNGATFALNSLRSAGMAVAFLMPVPGLAAWVTLKFITREGFGQTNLRLGPWRPYLVTWLLILAGYLVVYLLTWGLGLAQPDWQLAWFQNLFIQSGLTTQPMPNSAVILGALFISSVGPALLFSSLFAFGEEFGWRGFLLPKLMPLGKPVAYTLMALIWSAWHWPIVLTGFTYPGQPLWGVVLFTLLTGTLGTFLNELTLRYRSCLLPSWVHALFNTQKQGVWFLVFPTANVLLGGYAGLLGLVVWTALAAATVALFRQQAGGAARKA